MAKQVNILTVSELTSELRLWKFVYLNSSGEHKQKALREGRKLREIATIYECLTETKIEY